MSQPLVSILIPAYNAGPYIAETLESALGQTWQNTEIIVVDDGSRDDTLAIAKGYESSQVKVISQENRGASSARNRALKEAQGDFIQYFDADDLLNPPKIEDQVLLLQQNESGMLAACGTVHFFDGEAPEKGIHSDGLPFIVDSDDPLEWLLRLYGSEDDRGGMVHPGAWLVPRSVSDAAGLWNEELSLDDDGEYFARVVLASKGIRRSDTALSYYRRFNNRKSLSAGNSESHYLSALRSIDLKAQYILARTDSQTAKRLLAKAYISIAISSYPSYPKISDLSLKMAANMGGINLFPVMGGRFTEVIKKIFGWKVARVINHNYHQFKTNFLAFNKIAE
ncbi:glycosyltransferase family 2 protein [Synechocystis salina LEGE 06155]|nr:glycosyltransferase family 2 protein [Synechocystis salina LEGE 06155]